MWVIVASLTSKIALEGALRSFESPETYMEQGAFGRNLSPIILRIWKGRIGNAAVFKGHRHPDWGLVAIVRRHKQLQLTHANVPA